ncbi:MAG: response regulator transcription factor [Deltaproteobacteria bacterium]|nr:response regulator transcription factor [Deltaproteobacteria bacterium]
MVKLIIVDDHVVLRQGLCEMLQSRGNYEIVAQASDGLQLVEILKNNSPDLVIMDVAMPKLDGVQTLERLKAEGADKCPVLVLSADDGQKNVREVMRAGAAGFMPKNAGLEELEFAIEAILDGKTYLSPSVTASLMHDGQVEAAANNPLGVLTKREIEILTHLADGKPNRVIGKLLHISTRTVDTHRSNILKKLNVKTNAELVKLAISSGLISV